MHTKGLSTQQTAALSVHISFFLSFSTHVPACNISLSQYKVRDLKDGRFWGLAFCSLCLVKGYVLPSCPLWKNKTSFCVKPSYCLQVGVCTKNGEGRMEMSEKCQMPAGSVRCISPSEMFSPGKRVLASLTVVVQGHTCWWLWTKLALMWYEWIKWEIGMG